MINDHGKPLVVEDHPTTFVLGKQQDMDIMQELVSITNVIEALDIDPAPKKPY